MITQQQAEALTLRRLKMQYLLSADEYQDLKRKIVEKSESDRERLQRLCTLAAQHVPIIPDWGDDRTPRPWGCILSQPSPGYCDECPVSDDCPHPGKEWSK